ncbi:MAG: hypothetical protein NTV87_00140 [Ignavibacteriae bacterium]|nr:hypothetical protein [Ignavibacteriota bacterium]
MNNSLARYLNQFEWDAWQTGTFRIDQRSTDTINTKIKYKRFVSKIEEILGTGIDYFMAIERFKSGYDTHVHSLMRGLKEIPHDVVWALWFEKYGRNVVQEYDPALGANHYVTKYVSKSLCDWDICINGLRRKTNE